MKRLLLIAAALIVVAGVTVAWLARSVFTGANVRAAIEAQASAALGQPVSIGSVGASVYPRVTMDLIDVRIGQPVRVQLQTAHVGTGLRALLSRRVEGADVRIDGARLTLPLPPFGATGAAATPAPGGGRPPVEIVSIDEIVLKNVDVVSGQRTLRGDIELVPHGAGVQIRKVALAADGATMAITGDLTGLAPIAGSLDVTADALDLDRVAAFIGEFTASSVAPAAAGVGSTGAPSTGAAASRSTSPVDRLIVGMTVGKMTTGSLILSDFSATASITAKGVQFEPLRLGVFGGRYEGIMGVALGDVPKFGWHAKLTGIDAATLMAFAGSPGTLTGRLSGTVDLDGEGLQMEQALRTAHGRSRIDLTDGTIAGLHLVRTIVTATSGRGGLLASAGAAVVTQNAPGGEKFSRLGASLRLANGVVETSDVSMVSNDVELSAAGTVRLSSMAADLTGRAQLSAALSQQAGTDLYRYTQEGGRVTLPVTVSGPLRDLAVSVDVGDVAKRAIRNKAAEEAQKLLDKKLPGLGGLFQRKPKPKG